MIQLEDLIEMWKQDSVIDEMNLDDASRQSASLHSKYLELLSINKLKKKKLEMDFQTLLKDKWLWYNGKMSKAEMDQKGWDYDPMNGLKVLKGDMDRFYNSDPDIQKAQAMIDYYKLMIETLEEIMGNIRWRHQNIKNMIEWRKFTSGV
jgi:c-di-GMP-related signal transduction protein